MFNTNFPILIAGPCSAETEQQVVKTALGISKCEKVSVFRAGIWKPRTKPGTFEGVGIKALPWLEKVKKQTNLLIAVEVALSEHAKICLANRHIVDIIWLGARTTVNPFSVQAIANELEGSDFPVMVKNPINPDVELWAGAIERLLKVGVNQIAAIHRGFYPFEETYLRNIPKWELAIELKTRYPNIPIINDPSHISGNTEFIQEISQKALNLNFNGLMIETHINPKEALSDAKQQLTPEQLILLLKELKFRNQTSNNSEFLSLIEQYREQIDSIDYQLLELLSKRMKIIEDIGKYKLNNNVTVFQLRRWIKIIETRKEFGNSIGLDTDFVKKILQIVHRESIKQQTEIMNGSSGNQI